MIQEVFARTLGAELFPDLIEDLNRLSADIQNLVEAHITGVTDWKKVGEPRERDIVNQLKDVAAMAGPGPQPSPGLATSVAPRDNYPSLSQSAPSSLGPQPSRGLQPAPLTLAAPPFPAALSGYEGRQQAAAVAAIVAAPAALRLPSLGALTAMPALAAPASATVAPAAPQHPQRPQPAQEFATVPIDDLDLSMDLSRVIDMVDLERQMEAKVAVFEQQLHEDAAARVRAAAQAREQALAPSVADERIRAQQEMGMALVAQQAQQGQLVAESQAITQYSEAQFMAGVRDEMQQYEAHLVQQCAVGQREAMRTGVNHVQNYFEGVFNQRVGEMQQQYEGRCRDLAESLASQGRAELLRAEAHVGGEHQAMAARLRLESEELASVERRAATAARSSERSLDLASVREEKHVEFVESEANDRERAHRSELANHDRALRQELRDQDAHWRAELRHASEQAVAIATQQAIATRDAAQREVDQWAAEMVAASDERLREVMNSEDEATIEMQGAQSELLAWRAEAEACRDELNQAALRDRCRAAPCEYRHAVAAWAGPSLRMRPRAEPPTAAVPVAAVGIASPQQDRGAAARNDGEHQSSEKSSGEEFTRKRTTVKPVDLGSPPAAAGFRIWVADVCTKCTAASNRSQQRTIRYIKGAEACGDPAALLIAPKKWQPFDAELFSAVMRYSAGELKRKLTTCREQCYKQGVDLALMTREFRGDLSLCLDGLDAILEHLREPPDEALLHACVVPQLRKCKPLALDFELYDRAEEGSTEKTLQFLCDKARDYVRRKEMQDVVDSLLKPAPRVTPLTPKGTGKGEKARCGQDCIFRRCSTPPTKGDAKAMELGASAKMPDGAAGSGAAAEAPKKQMICNIHASVYDEWALDAAAALDVANSRVAGSKGKSNVATAMWSAGGIVDSNETVTADLAPLGETITAHVLPDTPNALALGRRCAEKGYGLRSLTQPTVPSVLFWPTYRLLDQADRAEHDAEADIVANDSKFEVTQVGARDEEQDYCAPCKDVNSPEHQSMHLPRLKGCPICDDAKHLHKYKLRRTEPMVHVTGQHAIDKLFGAMVHIDWPEIRRGTQGVKTAQRALMLTDDLTVFLGAGPSNSKEAGVVVELIHRCDDVPPAIRRWWSGRAAEFLAASRRVRSLRPLAHFASAPWPRAPKAERTNRTASEGARALLIQSGLDEACWAMALLFWIAMWNGFIIVKGGMAPYFRMHGAPAPCKQCAFGALVLFHPRRPVPQQGAEPLHDKLQSRLVPAVLIEIAVGPGGKWASSYGVIPLSRFTSGSRASKATIRRTMGVVFPADVTSPIKQRLAIHRATVDETLPAARVADDAETWEILEDKGDVDMEAEFFDGMWKDGAAKFDSSVPLGHVLALEPDVQGDEVQPVAIAPAGDFQPVDADIAEAQQAVDDVQPEIAIIEGAPLHWDGGSTALDEVETESAWCTRHRGHGARRLASPRCGLALGVLLRRICARSGGDSMHLASRRSDVEKDTTTRELRGATLQLERPAVALRPSATRVVQQARSMIITGDYRFLLLELGCSEDSELSAAAQERCLAVRIAAREDLTLRSTKRAIHCIISFCVLHEVEVHAWVSIPCTFGCPWKSVNTPLGVNAGSESLTNKLIDAAVQICEHVDRANNTFSWEWADRNLLWHDPRVVDMLARRGAVDSVVSSAAVGMSFGKNIKGTNQQVFIKKKWRVATTHPGVPIEPGPCADLPKHIPQASFVECRGKIAAASALYTPLMATLIWEALKPNVPRAMPCTLPDRTMERVLPPGPPTMPLWCCLITRLVNMKSQEAKTDKAKAAIEAELEGHRNRGTWDMSRVRSLKDWMAGDSYKDVVVSRVFVILGCKSSEMDEGQCCTYRDAYQAYLQAAMETDPAIVDLVELPKDWWPSSWFYDRDRTQPKYHRPAVPLVYALPGRPKSGNVWESHADAVFIVEMAGWRKVDGWHSIWLHADGSIVVIYVGDFLLAATAANAKKRWRELGQHIVFQEACAEVLRYLGALYHFDHVNPGYLHNLVDKFKLEYRGALRKVTTPRPTDGDYAAVDDEPGIFPASAASYVSSGLYASLVCRPDLSVAMQRMCSRVTRWTVADDIALIRFMSYVSEYHDMELFGQLAPTDFEHLAIRLWPDADWNGDSNTTKSTSGLYCELVGTESSNSFPLTWKVSRQTATSSSSAESETISASTAVRHCALPVQTLISDMLGVLVPIDCRVDNAQAIQAIKKGYSKRLRCFPRTHRCSIGAMREIYNDPEAALDVEYHATATHKGDFFTKSLKPAPFAEARGRAGMRRAAKL
ncbi:unnamed protein product [Prorocentrum cordatum]|uniref:Uncharacterized protein n=1 Tax=Prorocentrum cordatum TaxID=2364126 RepID=A0ABN9WCV8_9DINO|nr:unnamed protein product [Polarella glacialis]